MLKLLIALAVVGGLIFWLLPGPRGGEGPVQARVKPMLHQLQESGCDTGLQAGSTTTATLKTLQHAIEHCQQHAAARAERAGATGDVPGNPHPQNP